MGILESFYDLKLSIGKIHTFLNLRLKGCICYKTITSQNVSYEAQVKNFFIS